MMISFRRVTFLAAVVAAFAGGLLWNGKASVSSGLVSTAEARVGRPLTPMSYAGVARRAARLPPARQLGSRVAIMDRPVCRSSTLTAG